MEVYQGSLGITLTDTYTTNIFFESFNLKQAKLFDGVRWDSNDPLHFTEATLNFYRQNRIDPRSKTIVYSDSLNIDRVREIKEHVNNRIHDAYGIGTYFTNDVGAKPLNMVIKLTQVKMAENTQWQYAVKLSDTPGKHTGNPKEIRLCKETLNIPEEPGE